MPLALSYLDVTVLGWTPTDAEWAVLAAILAGAAATVLLMGAWRRARKAFLLSLLGIALLALWFRLRR